ncbi:MULTISPECIES: putative nucleotidyltransferase substrate binding domain-containing protein [Arcobacteraceae]|uniref:Cyclic nucleotide-binding protein n=1 Tax=Poseidonibacter parvus TaxID=1850254 RepID=A0A1P8KK59_9BACT|nr:MULTISPECIES: putative nucleotidyltransferase substrate binding domain-containing protein [Arcobacteraceae]APW64939.1 cyclic nucleotide-binding protein [Poseidonibacter parvus]
MSILEQTTFLKSIHPFENLTKAQLEKFAEALDIVYLKKDEIIQKQGDEPENIYFILKGLVQEKHEDEVLSIYSNNEFFDPISLIENYSKHTFVTAQETICYVLAKEVFIKTLRENSLLESFFFQSISQKLNANINNEKNKELSNLMVAKVKEANVHRAIVLPYETSIFDAVTTIKKEKVPTLLLKDDENKMYIVTDSDFREKVILNRMDFDDIVGKISNEGLVYVNENDFLFNAQLIMAKHGLKRVVVKNDNDEICGIIDQISLSSFFATHTFSVSNTIAKAETIEELKKASQSFTKIIKSLNAKGVKVDFISKLINQLNRNVMDKLFKMTAPKELLTNACLVVMGSEGRGEQILKTDQDNALIIDDNCSLSDEEILKFTHEYTEYLVDFGFPRCEGNIMVSNPYWCRRQKDYKDLIYEWITQPSGDNFMNLAIFYDAMAVNENRAMLTELKEYIFKIGSTSKTFYMHFAKIIMDFDVPLGFFDGFVFDSKNKEHNNEIDIKKGGIFIIVQSIRTLSLEYKSMRLNTIKRIKELQEKGELDEEFASELIEAFKFLLTIKLKSNLEKMDSGEVIDNYINPDNLNTMEKDLLKDSFKIVNRLKKKLEHHYKLNYV